MQENPDFARTFRTNPARFVMPLHPQSKERNNGNLIKLDGTGAEAFYLPNGDIIVKPEPLCEISCELPRFHYENFLGQQYRYFYAICGDLQTDKPGSVSIFLLFRYITVHFPVKCSLQLQSFFEQKK